MTARRTIATLSLVATLASGCAALRPVTTSDADYRAFRTTRVSPTLEGRLVAASRYLARFPDGAYAAEVRGFFTLAEPLYFEAHRSTVRDLHVYLAALPRGPHADEARRKLEKMEDEIPTSDGFDRKVMQTNARLSRMAKERASARDRVVSTLRAFMDPEAFARPLSEANPELVIPWSLALPWPRCAWDDEARETPMRCEKLHELPYEVTTGEGSEEHQATVEIAIQEDARGRPRRVTIGGPDLFVRLEETFSGRAIAPMDPSGRAAGVSRVTELVRREFAARISDEPACRKRSRAPRVLDLACHGMRVVVEAALDRADDDRIVLSPIEASAP